METKICFKCKTEKPLLQFRIYKSGEREGHRHSYCRSCEKIYVKEWKEREPWKKHYYYILGRCKYDKKSPYYGRVKNFLTIKDVKNLWIRDNAGLLKHPAIDRRNEKGHYAIENCRFIEQSENSYRAAFEKIHTVDSRKKQSEKMRNKYGNFCINGHEFTSENTYWRANGRRGCRVCQRKRCREYQQKRRANA